VKRILRPAYQPVRDLLSGRILYYEALARLPGQDANAHLRLIELGEAAAFIDLVDLAMLGHVAAALEANPGAVVALNVSGATIEHAVNELLAEVFRHMRVVPRMVFELTETVEIRDLHSLEVFLRAVRLLGARVAADDYGAGYCTERFVELTQAEFVKLSGSLVAGLAEGNGHEGVRALSQRVRGWGGEIIAEYVDSEPKARAMRALEVRYAQGYWVGAFACEPAEQAVVCPPRRAAS